jgi:hypothetical protein
MPIIKGGIKAYQTFVEVKTENTVTRLNNKIITFERQLKEKNETISNLTTSNDALTAASKSFDAVKQELQNTIDSFKARFYTHDDVLSILYHTWKVHISNDYEAPTSADHIWKIKNSNIMQIEDGKEGYSRYTMENAMGQEGRLLVSLHSGSDVKLLILVMAGNDNQKLTGTLGGKESIMMTRISGDN